MAGPKREKQMKKSRCEHLLFIEASFVPLEENICKIGQFIFIIKYINKLYI